MPEWIIRVDEAQRWKERFLFIMALSLYILTEVGMQVWLFPFLDSQGLGGSSIQDKNTGATGTTSTLFDLQFFIIVVSMIILAFAIPISRRKLLEVYKIQKKLLLNLVEAIFRPYEVEISADGITICSAVRRRSIPYSMIGYFKCEPGAYHQEYIYIALRTHITPSVKDIPLNLSLPQGSGLPECLEKARCRHLPYNKFQKAIIQRPAIMVPVITLLIFIPYVIFRTALHYGYLT